jgi:hypothetical protein
MLNLEVELISIKTGCGKSEYLKHSHSKVCWSGKSSFPEPQGVGRIRRRGGGNETEWRTYHARSMATATSTNAHVSPVFHHPWGHRVFIASVSILSS